MKCRWIAVLALVAAALFGATAEARVGVVVGVGPFWGPWYPPYYPYYYYPPAPVVVTPPAPPVYIERSQEAPPAAPAAQENAWYYCRNPQGYYPYVKQCNGSWERVPATPPAR